MSRAIEQVRIRSVADLAPLLNSSYPAYRATALSSILENPDKALQLAKHEGKDVIDVLIDILGRSIPRGDRIAMISVIGQFDDPRVDRIFRTVLLEEDDDEFLHLAARFARERELEIDRAALLIMLRSDTSMSKVRIAAELLVNQQHIETEDAIRIAAFSPGTCEFPELTDSTIDAWLSQLQGPYAEYLCRVMEQRGPAVDRWILFWSALGTDLRIWLVQRACYAQPPLEDVVLLGLADKDESIRMATLVGLRIYATPVSTDALQRALDDVVPTLRDRDADSFTARR